MIKTANTELIHFYWRLGQTTVRTSMSSTQGKYSYQPLVIVPQVEGQLQVADNYRIIFDIPWGHQKVIISKAQNIEEAF
nr:hypothetical protein [Bacteroides sp. K03]